jgi:hypothetical protein
MKKLFLYVLILSSCAKDQIVTGLNRGDFSISLNSKWTYVVTDHMSGRTDTITGIVTNSNLTLGGKSSLLEVTWSKPSWLPSPNKQYIILNDSLYAYYEYDSINNIMIPEIEFRFPLRKGTSWQSDYRKGRYNVVSDSIDSKKTFGLNFGYASYVQRNGDQDLGYQLRENIYIAKNVGIIFRDISERQGIPLKSQFMQLLSFEK